MKSLLKRVKRLVQQYCGVAGLVFALFFNVTYNYLGWGSLYPELYNPMKLIFANASGIGLFGCIALYEGMRRRFCLSARIPLLGLMWFDVVNILYLLLMIFGFHVPAEDYLTWGQTGGMVAVAVAYLSFVLRGK